MAEAPRLKNNREHVILNQIWFYSLFAHDVLIDTGEKGFT
jgi:hypothetical protein